MSGRSSSPPRSFDPLPRPGSFPAVHASPESRGPLWWSLGLALGAAVAVGWLVATHDVAPTRAASVLRASFGETPDALPPVPDVTPAPIVGAVGVPGAVSGAVDAVGADPGSVVETVTGSGSVADPGSVADTASVADAVTDTRSVADAVADTRSVADVAVLADHDHVDDEPSDARPVPAASVGVPERFTPGDVWSSPSRDRERSDALLAEALATEGPERRELLFEAALAHPGNPHVAFHLAREAQTQGDLELAELWARHAIRLRRRRDEYRTLLAEIQRAAGE